MAVRPGSEAETDNSRIFADAKILQLVRGGGLFFGREPCLLSTADCSHGHLIT